MNTRTVLLWHNNGEQRFTFTVNPAELSISRPNRNQVYPLAMGGTVNAWGGRGLREVRIRTFLPCAQSPFYDGTDAGTVLNLLRAWQDSGDPIRLIISGTDINDAFLIEDVTETLTEGDRDVGLTLTLREYKFKSALASLVKTDAPPPRADERVLPETYTVKRGDTLWGIACRFYGDGTKWGTLAAKNGVSDPRKLQIGTVLRL